MASPTMSTLDPVPRRSPTTLLPTPTVRPQPVTPRATEPRLPARQRLGSPAFDRMQVRAASSTVRRVNLGSEDSRLRPGEVPLSARSVAPHGPRVGSGGPGHP